MREADLMEMAAEILEDFSLEELLEINDLSAEDVLIVLFEGGYIGQPERIIARYEDPDEDPA